MSGHVLAQKFLVFAVVVAAWANLMVSANGDIIAFTHHTPAQFPAAGRNGILNFEWDTATNKFTSGVFLRSSGDFMSGNFTLNPLDQIWYHSSGIPERRVNLRADALSAVSLSDELSALGSFTVGQQINYGVNVVAPTFGVNENWATPGIVVVSTVTGAAAVPEPSSFALMAMGAAGVVLRRSRRMKKAVEAQV